MRTFGPATFHYAEGGNAELRLVEQQEQVGGSFLHVHVHRCSGEICVQVVCVRARRVRSGGGRGTELHKCKGEKRKKEICRVDGTDVTNTRRLGVGEVSISPLAQTWRAITGRWGGSGGGGSGREKSEILG